MSEWIWKLIEILISGSVAFHIYVLIQVHAWFSEDTNMHCPCCNSTKVDVKSVVLMMKHNRFQSHSSYLCPFGADCHGLYDGDCLGLKELHGADYLQLEGLCLEC